MASYSTRQRDPLLDSTMQAAIEKRGKELLGLGLIFVGMLIGMMLWSYSPDDPNWMLATDAPAQNWLGRFGASFAAPMMMIMGKAAWTIPLAFIVWGVRFVTHQGAERALGRIIFAPIIVAVASVYASTLTPGPMWQHSFGLGGMFGDTVLSILLTILPVGPVFGVKLMSLVMMVLTLVSGAFVLGFIRSELRAIRHFLFVGLIVIYSLILKVLGKSASASLRAAQGMHSNIQTRRADAKAEREWIAEQQRAVGSIPDPDEKARVAQVVRANPVFPTGAPKVDVDELAAPRRADAPQDGGGGLFGFMPKALRRGVDPLPEPELIESEPRLVETDVPVDDDRIRARISDVIRSRTQAPEVQPAPPPITRTEEGVRIEPTLVSGRGPQPLVVEAPMVDEPLIEDERNIFADAAQSQTHIDPLPTVEPRVSVPVPEARKVVQHPVKKAVAPSRQAQAEAQPQLAFEDKTADYELPPLNLLMSPDEIERHVLSDEALEENARMLESVLDDYGIKGEIVSVRPGPVVTMYELEPAPGLKASRVIGLADDIARSMSALSARVSTLPGRSVIGIELPNDNREMVCFREILSGRDYGDGKHKLPLALGKDIGGDPVVANLAKMPHLLIAGTTGSGKSVAINTMILSLLYKLSPDECRLIMIDPKMLELSVYDGIPHLLSPVVTDPKKAVVALKWVVGEMEERYRKMSKMGVRNIDGYNGRVEDALSKNEMFSRTVQTGFDEETGDPIFETEEFAPEKMPYIVVVVDEMADLMMVAGKEIEACIQRLAQMARASGIHLIMATQRPSVDVITGTIKANFPTRISFQVTSKVDSRTILGEQGAEQLLGMGDMLYMAGGSKIIRVHGPFVSDEEVEEIVNHLKAYGPPEYVGGVVDGPADDKEADIDAVLGLSTGGNTDMEDALYDTAVAIVIKDRKCSTSYIQRKLSIGYNKAARLVEQMEDNGVVSAANHVGKREILVPEQG
jgi:S-DNA-T family DNA segregation ATPase FtsK/SpoIIIE